MQTLNLKKKAYQEWNGVCRAIYVELVALLRLDRITKSIFSLIYTTPS